MIRIIDEHIDEHVEQFGVAEICRVLDWCASAY